MSLLRGQGTSLREINLDNTISRSDISKGTDSKGLISRDKGFILPDIRKSTRNYHMSQKQPKFVAMPTSFSSKSDDFPTLRTQHQYYEPENILEVEVRNPRTHGTTRSMYTDYEIVVRSNMPLFKRESSVRRRFSDFVAFREVLEREQPNLYLAQLPPKVFRNRFSDEVIQERTKKSGLFIQQIASHPLVQTNAPKLLVSFMQDDHWDANAWLYG